MKGLLIKDFQLLKRQGLALVVMLLCSVYFMINGKAEFGITYICAMGALLSMTTISYDEYEEGLQFLFTLPVRRSDYVWEKYLFAGISLCISLGISVIVGMVVAMNRSGKIIWSDLLGSSIGGITAGVVLVAIAAPVFLKCGAEKGRIVLAMVIVVVIACFMAGAELIDGTRFIQDLKQMFAWIDGLGTVGTFGIFVIVWIVIVGVSAVISMRVMKKREF